MSSPEEEYNFSWIGGIDELRSSLSIKLLTVPSDADPEVQKDDHQCSTTLASNLLTVQGERKLRGALGGSNDTRAAAERRKGNLRKIGKNTREIHTTSKEL